MIYDKAILIENYSFFINKCMNSQLMFLKLNISVCIRYQCPSMLKKLIISLHLYSQASKKRQLFQKQGTKPKKAKLSGDDSDDDDDLGGGDEVGRVMSYIGGFFCALVLLIAILIIVLCCGWSFDILLVYVILYIITNSILCFCYVDICIALFIIIITIIQHHNTSRTWTMLMMMKKRKR